MEVLFESRTNIRYTWGKLYFRQVKPEILPEPVLVGDTLTIEYADGRTTELNVPPADLPDVLTSLDVTLNEEEVDRLRLI
mgnify:CR=1 FL=1